MQSGFIDFQRFSEGNKLVWHGHPSSQPFRRQSANLMAKSCKAWLTNQTYLLHRGYNLNAQKGHIDRQQYIRCKKLLMDLRQACCDTQIVRDETEASSSNRRSMDHIMTELALKAYNSFDAGLRGFLQSRMLVCCLGGLKGKNAGKGRLHSLVSFDRLSMQSR